MLPPPAMRTVLFLLTLLLPFGLVACQTPAPDAPSDEAASGEAADTVVIDEAFVTARDTADNVDSPAVWHGPDGQHWLLTTAKEGDVVRVFDAVTGDSLRRVGGSGAAPGAMDRPNGIAVVDDLLLVVERNNRRVQGFALPSFAPLGTFGQQHLRRPYGLTVVPQGGPDDEQTAYTVYVTDAYEAPDESVPPLGELGERVKQYRLTLPGDTLQAELVRSFGDTTGTGVLKAVESIWADPENDRLLIAEEREGESQIKVYDLNGRFRNETIPTRFFPHEAEGIVLYRCDAGGYWITTDQSETGNTFHIFDRADLAYRGSFRGQTVSNTDGIAVTERAFGSFPRGALYAVHNDGNTGVFSWALIADALRLEC